MSHQPLGLRAALNQLGWSHQTASAVLGVSARTVGRWAAGEATPPFPMQVEAQRRLREHGITADLWRPLPTPATPPPQEDPLLTTTREYLTPEELTALGLPGDPFEDSGDPTDLWLPPQLQALEQSILAACKRHRLLAVVAPPGAGKSCLLRRIYAMGRTHKALRLMTLASLDRRKVNHTSIAVAMLRDLTGRSTSSMPQEERSDLLRETLAAQEEQGNLPALLVEEAHLLPSAALIAIKQVWDSHTLFHQLAVVLVGHPLLGDRLRNDPGIRELAGRLQLLSVPTLSAEDVDAYLHWRWARVAGGTRHPFEPAAVAALAQRGMYPLWVNNLAVRTLRVAARTGAKRVLATHVGRASVQED